LLKKQAFMFNEHLGPEFIDQSAFFIAINSSKIWAVEMLYDYSDDVDFEEKAGGTNPLLYAAERNLDEMCMYLSLRSKDLNAENEEGKTVLVIYLLRKDIDRMKQLIMRGCDVNHISKGNQFTPLHWAIENKLSTKIIKFLLQYKAYMHYEDKNGLDCCDKANKLERYNQFKAFKDHECLDNPRLRMNVNKKHKLKSKSVTVGITKVIRDHHKQTTEETEDDEILSDDLDNFKFCNSETIQLPEPLVELVTLTIT
jgi:ankyrin repeat protein